MSKLKADIRAAARSYLEAAIAHELAADEEGSGSLLKAEAKARLQEIAERQAEAYGAVCESPARTVAEYRAKAAVWLCEALLRGEGLTDLGLSIARDLIGSGLEAFGDDEASAACEFLRRGLV